MAHHGVERKNATQRCMIDHSEDDKWIQVASDLLVDFSPANVGLPVVLNAGVVWPVVLNLPSTCPDVVLG